jgi:hypothetical protein
MTIQMAAESNDIFKSLLRDTEDTLNNMWKIAANIETPADRINNAKNSVVLRLSQILLMRAEIMTTMLIELWIELQTK